MKLWLARNRRMDWYQGGARHNLYVLCKTKPRWGADLGGWISRGGGYIAVMLPAEWHRWDPDKQLRLKPGEGPVEVTIERVGNATGN